MQLTSIGARGWSIVDYSKERLEIPENCVRSEQEQADYLAKLLAIYEAEKIGGAFVYDFSTPLSPYSPNSRYDLDMASFAVVKAVLVDSEHEATRWEPKRAFQEVARTYSRLEHL